MKLLNVEAVLDRDEGIQRVEHETEVMKELHDKTNSYAILSHRWGSDSEVNYEEMTGLMKMGKEDREEVRQRCGYQKIIKSCEQAKKDGYRWLWVDTCCIDKRSSAELTEAINSMYRWYRNSQVCYVYLNDVHKSEFPTEQDFSWFGKSNGWPEWFSRGWTLQELIAPRDAEFFNKDWVPIGSKQSLMSTLTAITRIPKRVLQNEGVLRNIEVSQRPRIAQIMSWAAERETTRVEDRAYSLLGLFGVNMPMLYGEGSKAFQRLQLEIIRVSSDHSIFAWNPKGRFGFHSSVLADHPGCFRGCHDIQEVYPDQFCKELERYIQWKGPQVATNWSRLNGLQRGAASTQLFRFDVTNLGIQVSLPVMPLPPRYDTDNFESYTALLPCYGHYGELFTINLRPIERSFCRSFRPVRVPEECPVFRSLYLDFSQYAEESYRELRFHDKRTSYYGFTRRGAFPRGIAGDTATLSSQGNNLIVLVYANDKDRSRFAAGFGYYLDEVWARIVCDEYPADQEAWSSWADFAKQVYNTMWNTPIDEGHPPQYSTHSILNRAHLPRSTSDAMIIHFNRDRNINITDIMIDIKPCPGCCTGPLECKYELFPDELWFPSTWTSDFVHELELDGQSARLGDYTGRIALGDYGYLNKNKFEVCGNIFQDMQELGIDSMGPVYQPVVSLVSSSGRMPRRMQTQHDIVTRGIGDHTTSLALHQPKGYLLPNNAEFHLLLRALSTRLARRDLVTAVIQCSAFYKIDDKPTQMDASASVWKGGEQSSGPGTFTPLCTFYPQVPQGSPACDQRREKFKGIREHFYALANLQHHPSGSNSCHGSLRDKWVMNGSVDCSDMFALESLKRYVGEITFFKRLPSMMETQLRNEVSVGSAGGNGLSARPVNPSSFSLAGLGSLGRRFQPSTNQNKNSEVVASLLVCKCELLEYLSSEKPKTRIEVESIARTLSIGLLEHICNTLLDASEGKPPRGPVGHADSVTVNVHSTVREIEALQVRLQATADDDDDGRRALEEEITGKILWFYRCGIRSEVDQVLSGVINCIPTGPNTEVSGRRFKKGLREMAEIVKGTPRILDLNDDQAHLQRIMLDAGAGISRHKLWLAAQAAGQAMWLGTSGVKPNASGTQHTASSARPEAPSTSNALRTLVTGKERV